MIRITLLGPLRVVIDGVDVTPTAGRERHILVLLALHRSISAAKITAALWAAPPPSARNSIHVAINRLRTRLGSMVIDTTGSTYLLDAAVSTDCDDLTRLEHLSTPDDARAVLELVPAAPSDILPDLRFDPDVRDLAERAGRCRALAARKLGHS